MQETWKHWKSQGSGKRSQGPVTDTQKPYGKNGRTMQKDTTRNTGRRANGTGWTQKRQKPGMRKNCAQTENGWKKAFRHGQNTLTSTKSADTANTAKR